jgi:hypothetical protein
MLELARLFLQIITQVAPPIIEEHKRRRELGLSNEALELAVLRHKDEIRSLPIQQVIEIGVKKAA